MLYRVRVKAGAGDIGLGAIAAMSLQLTVAKAVYDGFVKDGIPFMRTDKGGAAKKKTSEQVVLWETLLGLALAAAAAVLHWTNVDQIVEMDFFAATLAVQSLPLLAATLMRGIELWQHRASKLEAVAKAA
jgi:hypothetical protein